MLAWTSSYPSFPSATNVSPKEAILSMKKDPIGATNDGCPQIQVPDTVNGGRMFWSRQYYIVPLEILSPPFLPPCLLTSFSLPFVCLARVSDSMYCR